MLGLLLTFYKVLLPVMLIFGAGFLLGRKFKLDQKTLSTLSIYLLTPALVFQAIMGYPDFFSWETLKILGVITVLIALTTAGVELAALVWKIPPGVRIVLILTLTLTNSGNFGLPISEYAFGKQGLILATLLLIIYVFYTHTFGVTVAASGKGGLRAAAQRALKVPVFYAMILAMILSAMKIRLPDPVFLPIQSVGMAAIPLNLLQVGIALAAVDIRKDWGVVLGASAVKLVVVPLAAAVLLVLAGVKGSLFEVSLVQVAMPSAVYCSILAAHFDADAALSSAIVFMSLLLSVVTLTVLIFLLQSKVFSFVY